MMRTAEAGGDRVAAWLSPSDVPARFVVLLKLCDSNIFIKVLTRVLNVSVPRTLSPCRFEGLL